jgi:DNA-binding beta-propeller fold protein YncE/thiol-disulfide isomerase/thioredoxin
MRQLVIRQKKRFDHSGATTITLVATDITDSIGINLTPKSLRLAVVAVAGLWFGGAGLIGPFAQAEAPPTGPNANVAENPYPHRVAAPPLEGGEWVNTPAPLALADLRGRYVLLDFWTFCCINCMHVLPELNKLEHAFPNELVVIGVHSAKFQGERATDNIREAVLRYEIEHPVVNDAKMTIWGTYGARSWPTLVLIDPAGDVVWAASGERSFDEIKAVIDRGLPYYRAQGILKPAPRPTIVGASKQPATPLRYPGKILADEKGGRLFIADSNHDRIVVAKLDGKLEQVVGSGVIGHEDGAFDACSFNHPQGMALVGNVLYIADTENHLLRKADLTSRHVTTVAGTGEKGVAWAEFGGAGEVPKKAGATGRGTLKSIALSSPWALWQQGNDLYIAMAGMHQIWRMPLDELSIGPYAGSARENIADGALLPGIPYNDQGFASFAQPSGLSSDGKHLFVADSEGSTVRSVPFEPNGKAETLVGLTGTLFDFGDTDGTGRDVRLQHPLDVAWADGKLCVADTYNNKIKVIDVERRTCRTLAGTGKAGNADSEKGGEATFNEPAGISAAGGKLYVADTNSHLVRVVDLAGTNGVTTLKIDGLAPPQKK